MKNLCDGAFGHVKRKLWKSNVHAPVEMMQVIEDSSISTTCVPPSNVPWLNWNQILSQSFCIPSKIKVSQQHCFSFTSEEKGCVTVR